ncbi:MAG TPA: SDR family NAD(P)-dependent oxidoreductase [Tepidisphaeraceae bacterium]
MTGRVALITGAGRGIGLAMAKALAAKGCAVAIQDVDLDVAQAEAASICRDEGQAIALGGDITDLSLPPRLVAEIVERLGGLHVLINNAAIQSPTTLTQGSVQEIERQVSADFIAPILLCREAAAIFRGQRWGRIVNLGSIQQLRGNADMMAYAMCKASIENLTRGLARELAKDGVTVNCVAPGWVDTHRNRFDFASEKDKAEKGRRHIPLGRIGEPSDYAGVALLLCSDAGSYITGQTIYVDGGMSIR